MEFNIKNVESNFVIYAQTAYLYLKKLVILINLIIFYFNFDLYQIIKK